MNFITSSCIFSLTLFFGVSTAWSIPDTALTHNWSSSTLIVDGPADSYSYQKILLISADGRLPICNDKSLSYNLAKIEYSPIVAWAETAPWGRGDLFETGVKGIKFSLYIGGGGSFPGGNSIILGKETKVLWTGYISNEYRSNSNFRYESDIYIVKGRDRLEDASIIPSQPLYRFTCYDTNNVARETSTLNSSPLPINIKVTGCTPDGSARTINMDGVPVANINNADATTLIATKQQNFSLRCDPNIKLSYSIVDLNDPTNTTATSTLTSDSSATGVGYAITSSSGTRLQFGPDGSSLGIPDQTKYPIGVAGSVVGNLNNPMSLQLGFSYVRKPEEAIKTGSAKSLIGITYSYQ